MPDLSPPLNTGMMVANLNALGTMEFFIDKLTKCMSGGTRTSVRDFRKLVSSPKISLVLELFKVVMISITSGSVISWMLNFLLIRALERCELFHHIFY